MRKAVLIIFCVAALGFAGWKAYSLFNEEEVDTCATLPKVKAPPAPTTADRYTKALASAGSAKLDAARPVFALRILTVAHGSAAESKGIKPGDEIGKLDGEPVDGLEEFSAKYDLKNDHTVSIWSATSGAKDHRFTGRMGVTFVEDSHLDAGYAQSKERSPAWDGAMTVATRSIASDPEVALHALADAKQKGYSGWLDPAVSVVANAMLNRPGEAAKFRAGIKTVPKESAHFVRSLLFRSAVLGGQLDVAADMEKEPGANKVRPSSWDMDSIYARDRALTAQERALIGADGKIKQTPIRDLSKTLAGYDANGKMALGYMQSHSTREFGFCTEVNQHSIFQIGPFTQNASLKIVFNFDEWKVHRAKPGGSINIGLNDSLSATGEPIAELRCTPTDGGEMHCEGYPAIFIAKELIHPNDDNTIEVVVNGPWVELWLNGQNVLKGITPLREREMYISITGDQAQGKFKNIEYAELDAGGWKPGAARSASKLAAKAVPALKAPASGDLKWFFDAYVTGYLNHGKRNPAWDADAVGALALAARFFGRDATADPTEIIKLSGSAVDAGCDDPLLLKIHGDMLCFVETKGSPVAARLFKRAADGIVDTQYNALLKFQIVSQCARFENATDLDPLIERADKRWVAAANWIPAAFEDASAPGWFVRTVFIDELGLTGSTRDRLSQLKKLQKALDGVPRAASVALTFKGSTYIDYAWDARGGGWASEVTQPGWKLFGERIKVAKQSLTKAWELDPKNSTAMEKLITVAMAGEADVDAAVCFQNAVTADPANIEAYDKLLYAMTPRWGGSTAMLHQFGQLCYDQVKKDPTLHVSIAHVLISAHENLASDVSKSTTDADESATLVNAYWQDPQVWLETDRVFKLILERAPTNLAKSEYAYYATKCKKWDVAKKLFDELGANLAPAPFGGPQQALIEKKKATDAAAQH